MPQEQVPQMQKFAGRQRGSSCPCSAGRASHRPLLDNECRVEFDATHRKQTKSVQPTRQYREAFHGRKRWATSRAHSRQSRANQVPKRCLIAGRVRAACIPTSRQFPHRPSREEERIAMAATLSAPMAARYCDVALPIPLRSTFTYAVPAALDGEILVGRRIVVPFGRRAMIGVGLTESDRAPEGARFKSPGKSEIKEIAELMDPLPALPPKLIELGHWISRYYLAPIGEAFRAMLPPEIELRHDREYSLTDAGRAYLSELAATEETTDVESSELNLLQHLDPDTSSPASARARRRRVNEAAAEALVRRGYLAARDILRPVKTRTQKIVAWRPGTTELLTGAAEKRIREVLTATRGPLPLALLLEKADASRAVVQRLEKAGMLQTWEEPITPGEDAWDTDRKSVV